MAGHSKGKLDENVTWYFDLVDVAMVLGCGWFWFLMQIFVGSSFLGGFAVLATFARKPLGGKVILIDKLTFVSKWVECTN